MTPLALESLAERNSQTHEWLFRQIRNYGPRDPRFLDCTDLDIVLDVATWVYEKKRQQGEVEGGDPIAQVQTRDGVSVRPVGHGVTAVHAATEPASLDAAVEAIRAGRLPGETDEEVGLRIVAAAMAAIPEGPTEDEAEEAKRLLAELGL